MSYDLAETCVFGKQSPGPGHCGPLYYEGAPLLPKLRGHFAEFLRESYLAPLSILYLPTCVSFGYRYFLFNVVRAFLGSMTSGTWEDFVSDIRISFSSYSNLNSVNFNPIKVTISLLRPSVQIRNSTGILTCFPSTTPFGLALGPD